MRVIDAVAKSRFRRALMITSTLGLLILTIGATTDRPLTLVVGMLFFAAPLLWMLKGLMELSHDVRSEARGREDLARAMEKRSESLARDLIAIERDSGAEVRSLNARVKSLSMRAKEASAKLQEKEELLQSLREDVSDFGDDRLEIVRNLDLIVERIRTLESDRTALRGQQRGFSVAMEQLRSIVDQFEWKATASVDLLMGSANQGFNRLLSVEERSELTDRWLPRLDLELSGEVIHYIERRVVTVEQICHGRLAASSADAVFRVLVGLSINSESREILEIGTLFGVNAALFWDTLGASRIRVVQTLVDLFEGYYGNQTPDQYTGLVATEGLVRANLRRVGADSDDFRLLKGDSHSPGILERVSDRKYDLVLIDGDHSFEGVSGDFERYWPLVKQGGYLLIDDYGARSWPSVTRFVDELAEDSQFEGDVEIFARTALVERP